MTTAVKERVEGHYEVEEVPYGKVYKWVPGHALIECDCEQLFAVEGTTAAACPRCGVDYTEFAKGLGNKPLKEEEVYHTTQRQYEEWAKEQEAHRGQHKQIYSGGLFSGLTVQDEMNRMFDVLYGT